MAKDFIKINSATAHGAELMQCIRDGQAFLNKLRKLNDVMLHNAADPDYADIATLFGLSRGAETGSQVGQAAYNLLAGTLGTVDVAAVNSFLEQIGAV